MSDCGVYYLLSAEIIFNLLKKDTTKKIEENFLKEHLSCCLSASSLFEVINTVNKIKDSNSKRILLKFLMEVIVPTVRIICFDAQAALVAARLAKCNEFNDMFFCDKDYEELAIAITNDLVFVTTDECKYKKLEINYPLKFECWK